MDYGFLQDREQQGADMDEGFPLMHFEVEFCKDSWYKTN